MFGTLLGPLPRPPVASDAPREAILDAILDVQLAAGLEPVTDGGWPLVPDDPVAAWRGTAARTATTTKAVLQGPFTQGIPYGGSVEPWRRRIADLAAAGCPLVEVHEPAAVGIGDDPAERARFRDLHERLADGWSRHRHLSLAITGGSADAGRHRDRSCPRRTRASRWTSSTDPDNWRLVRAAPRERGIVCGALDTSEGSDDGPELLLWAVGYAAERRPRHRPRRARHGVLARRAPVGVGRPQARAARRRRCASRTCRRRSDSPPSTRAPWTAGARRSAAYDPSAKPPAPTLIREPT